MSMETSACCECGRALPMNGPPSFCAECRRAIPPQPRTLEDILTCHDCRRGIPLEGWDPDDKEDTRAYMRGLVPAMWPGQESGPCLVCRGCHAKEARQEEWEDPPPLLDEPLSADAMLILCILKGVKLPSKYEWQTPPAIPGDMSHGRPWTGPVEA
eukprot:jgi/Mesvir1/15321/Mv06527-RA.1